MEATEFLDRQQTRGRIYSYTLWNTYLLYHLYPRCRTFFDTRHIYGGMKPFREAYVMGEGLEGQGELFDWYQVDILVVNKDFRFAPREARRWKRVFRTDDGGESVFVRRDPAAGRQGG